MASNYEETPNVWDKNDCEEIKAELVENGYAVVRGVMTEEDCDECTGQFREWIAQFDGADEELCHKHSFIQKYRIGHFESSWRARLNSKTVFSQIWDTDKLLSSFDGVAIGEPPEMGNETFARVGERCLQLDQGESRRGLHAYEGAVYLEEASETDWVCRVLSGSHKYHDAFFDGHPPAASRSKKDTCRLKDTEIKWYEDKGCKLTPVPVPKGGMVLWDSRTVHDSRRPEHGRPNADRWRFVVFVSMTPAIWANSKDLQDRRTAYKRLLLTTHWSSQGTSFLPEKYCSKNIKTIDTLPDIACTDEAKLLSGAKEYNFNDSNPNGDRLNPIWKNGNYSKTTPKMKGRKR